MRILFITTKSIGSESGISRVDCSLYNELKKRAHADICYLQPIRIPLLLQRLVKQIFKKDLQGFFNNIPFLIPNKNFAEYDFVYFMNQLNTLALNWIITKNVVVGVRDVIFYLSPKDRPSSRMLRMYHTLCFRGIKRAKAIIADSESEKHNIAKCLNYDVNHIYAVHLGVDKAKLYKKSVNKIKYAFLLDKRYRNILFVGTESPRKNARTLLRAIAEIKKKMSNIRLIKIGKPLFQTEREKNTRLVAELGIEKNVVFVDSVSEESLADYYNGAELLVMPSLMEGFGLPLIEAMSCGCPAVASKIDVLREIGGDAPQYVDNPLNHKELSEKIMLILENKTLRQNMAEKGLKRAQQFSWGKTADKILRFFKRLRA